MFCDQCEQTSKSTACTVRGVCGKDDEVAAIQDALVYALEGLALVAEKAAPLGLVPDDTYPFIEQGLFATLSNVNFDPEALTDWVRQTVDRREKIKTALVAKDPGATFPDGPATFVAGYTAHAVAAQGREHAVNKEATSDANIRSLQHTVLYGLKGVAAYAHHAHELGYRDKAVDDYHVEALADLARYNEGDLMTWVGKAMRCGEINYKVMELLDRDLRHPRAHRGPAGRESRQGHPGLGPRPARPVRTAQADRRQGHHHLHPW
jgi:hydroxylamine reductase